MNKFGLSVVLSLGLALSPLCALELESNTLESRKNVQISSLSQTDTEFLFATNVSHLNVVALSDEEMEETEGESLLAFGAGIWTGVVAYKAIKSLFK